MFEVEGRTAVITGAAGGIGLAAARAFAAAGVRLVLADIDESRLRIAADKLMEQGAEVEPVPTDVTSVASLEELREAALARFGTVHIVCSNAGGPLPRRIRELSAEDWTRGLNLNLYSVINGVRIFLPLLEEQDQGHISATASMSGLVPFPPVATYNVAKAGVISFMETLAHELKNRDSPVAVSVLCPGEVATHGVENTLNIAQAVGYEASQEESALAVSAQAGILEGGLDPDEVGRIYLDGIRQGRFWIFTHPAWVEGPLKKRHEMMTTNGSLLDI